MNAITGTARIGDSRLAARLARETSGEVLFGAGDRGRYATDASIYQMDPVGVLVPRTAEDVAAAMSICREEGVPVLPRGGGTSQCGQTVNRALVIDCTKHLRQVLAVEGDTATVQPGITLGALNEALKPRGLFFPVDPSTWMRCTIGGMAANNSCGSKSIRYGLMADNVRAIDAILADGTRFGFGELPDNLGPDVPASVAALVAKLRAIGVREAEEIAARFPEQLRRVGGYNLDALTPDARANGRASLARLLVGSEGTLAFSAALDLKLWPIKPRKVLGICQFPSFRRAMEASRHLVTLDPEAVELVDRTMIDLGRSIPIYRNTIDRIVIGEPDSLLIVEFHGQADAPLLAQLERLEEMMGDLGLPGQVVRVTDDGGVPPDNPFVGRAGALPEIWSYGHRNPQGLAVDPANGHLWAHEHGPQGGDELNLIQKGGNYGWPVATKGLDYSGATISPFQTYPGMIDGRAVWVPSIAPSGLAVYRGALWPAWAGDLIVGALVTKEVRRLDVDADGRVVRQERIFPSIKARIRDVRVAPDGAVWLTTDEDAGKVLRVTP